MTLRVFMVGLFSALVRRLRLVSVKRIQSIKARPKDREYQRSRLLSHPSGAIAEINSLDRIGNLLGDFVAVLLIDWAQTHVINFPSARARSQAAEVLGLPRKAPTHQYLKVA